MQGQSWQGEQEGEAVIRHSHHGLRACLLVLCLDRSVCGAGTIFSGETTTHTYIHTLLVHY